MTTIIVIVVVALVFFVAVCAGAFVILKNEAEMRSVQQKKNALNTRKKK